MLADLVNLTVDSLAGCADPTPTLLTPRRFPIALESKRKLVVKFTVPFACANDPAKTRRTAPHDDYRHTVVVNHAALDGVADSVPADDVCPPSSHATGKKGCGTTRAGKTYGADVLTDVEVR